MSDSATSLSKEAWIDVPEIDISPLLPFSKATFEDKMKVAKQIDAVCRRGGCGFFYAKNHGVDLKELSRVTKKFHMSMTPAEKFALAIRAYNPANVKQVRSGYYLAVEGKKANESFCILNPNFTTEHPRILSDTPMHEVNRWPDESKHPGFRAYQESYYWMVFDVAAAILRGFALALGKDEHFFDQYFTCQDTLSSVSLIRYPFLENYPPVKVSADGVKLSFDDHYDVSMITVLYQSDVPNLQVQTPEGWRSMQTNDQCYLVNVGTYMEYATKGYYPSPLHRVKFVNVERQSLAFFGNLGHESTIEPFAPPGHEPGVEKKAPLSYGEYLQNGLQALIQKNGQT